MPLKSIRVLDLTRLLPGPYCTMVLADFGAEVIKIEEPQLGDYVRFQEPKIDENSAFFHSLNRNKKSVAINLKSEEGKAAFLKLVESTDVVVESFRPGVMDRLGIGYEKLKEINPSIIYCAITGYGQTGPYVEKPGHDINYMSYAGLLDIMGERDGDPVVPAVQVADIGGGALPAIIGILLALMDKDKSGKGQVVDIAMMDNIIPWLQTTLPDYIATKELPKRGELTLSGGKACYGVYKTKDNKYLSVGSLEPKFWEEFCNAIERKDLISQLDAPLEEQYRMKYEIQQKLIEKTQAEWDEIFSTYDTCVAPILTFEEMMEDPQVIAREMIKEVEHQTLGKIKQIGIPIKLSETPGEIRTVAPKLGEHTQEILKDIKV
ncbi:CaiB/BaiF CoA transferase family protein [Oceanobacillus sp. CF4.6]|uniref:CaiB/BaiF CoA transferase family protein n=1 Tax=Oceanobacillus sp. CF4.6 TaxID=3373080 RepID=UPI003EE4AC1A